MFQPLRFVLLCFFLITPTLFADKPTIHRGLADYRKEYTAIAAAGSAEQMHEMLADRQRRIETYLRHLADTVPGTQKVPGITMEGDTFHISISPDKNQEFESLIEALGGLLVSLLPEGEYRDQLVAELLEKGMSDVDLNTLLTTVSEGYSHPAVIMQQTRKYLEVRTRFAYLLSEDIEPWARLSDADLKEAMIALEAAGAYGLRGPFVEIMMPLSKEGRLILLDMTVIERGGRERTIKLTQEVTDTIVAEARREINRRIAQEQKP